jgi:hypothetical protein
VPSTRLAISVAKTLIIEASVRTSRPASCLAAASSAINWQAWIAIAASAIHH